MPEIIVTPNLADAVTAARLHAQRAELAQNAAVDAADDATTAAQDVYVSKNYGVLGTDPPTRPDGTPSQNGDQYYNSVAHAMKIRIDGEWAITALPASTTTSAMIGANNLLDVSSASQSRINLGLGTAAVLAAGLPNGAATLDGTGKLPASQFNAAITGALAAANNLNDLTNAPTARANLGLGTAATETAGAAGGVADLDGSGKVPSAQLPIGTANGVASLDATGHVPLTQMNAGVANGVASLNSGGIVPLTQLPAFGNPTTVPKSADYTTIAGDSGKVIYVTTGSTTDVNIAFVSATTAGDGALMIIQKADSGTKKVIVKDSDGTTVITWLSNQFDAVVFRSNGSAWSRYWHRITPRVDTYTGNSTWTKPPLAQTVLVSLQGPGGGGGAGSQSGAAYAGGTGGGGGSRAEVWFNAADLSSTETVTVPAGAAGGSGSNGSDASPTLFGTTTRVLAGGGFGGNAGGTSIAGYGGGVGGAVPNVASVQAVGFEGGGPPTSGPGKSAVYGGGSGGPTNSGAAGGAGGSSLYGGGGGGGGGQGTQTGGAGGKRGTYTAGGGAAGGAPGSVGASLGVGGGGGNGVSAGTGSAGGAGGTGAGGGGGGGGTTVGAGGAGGRGEATVTTVF